MGARVSAIIPLYNGARHIRTAIDSVLAQDQPPDEVIVVNDGSTDDSPSIVGSYDKVTLLQQPKAGPAGARNAGILAASGDLIAFLDQDDLWTPDKLRLQVAHLDANPHLGFVLAWQRHFLETDVPRPGWFRPELVDAERPCIGPGTLVAHRRLFDDLGLFDTTLRTASDGDWILRGRDLGVAFDTMTDVLLLRRIHDTNQSADVPTVHAEMLRLVHDSLARRRRQGVL
jgi:glycosyltransferase involved in cell wall biosynthesis